MREDHRECQLTRSFIHCISIRRPYRYVMNPLYS